ncbi:response regulator [Pseudanabaena sp. PCC 6802]|uniref:response regulator n=1 Tax=Pseudanabaena sp. PCC 6802 TaxID=118173 RepID=UPI000344A292|nr:response regulator [Pseudanabaena sp. PCC 6802]
MKILVVEDDRAVAQSLEFLFSAYNYAVDIAADGEVGLQMAEAFAYDLILLDAILPKLHGVSLCKQLRAKGFQSPILLLTGQGEGWQKANALNAGADDYVTKPFDPEELIARVQALLRRGNLTNQPVLTFGHLSVDPSRCQVAYGDRLLVVTPKEYAILELLLRDPENAFSARTILEHVWTSLEAPGEETVRVHIRGLRQKLTKLGAPKDFIDNQNRRGYRLNPLYTSPPVLQTDGQLTAPQIAELNAANAQLRATLEELRSTQAEMLQKDRELEIARQRTIELTATNAQLRQEISDREQLETTLQESAEQLRLALDLNRIGMWEWQVATGDVTWNDYNYRLLGYQPGEVEPSYQFWHSHIHPDDVAEFDRKTAQALETQTDYEAELRVVRRDGSMHWLLGKGRGLYNEAGQPVRMLGVAFDISERKQLEAKRQQAELALQQQLRREQLIADIAGDIRQSLKLNDVLSRTVERIREVLNCDRVFIYRFHADWSGTIAIESVSDRYPAALQAEVEDLYFMETHGEDYRQGRIQAVADIHASNLTPCHIDMLAQFHIKANLVVPILQGERLWGLLVANQCAAPRMWQPEEIDLFQQIATQAGIAIQQSELLQSLQMELVEREHAERKIREQATLLDIATDAIFVRDLDHRILFWNRGAERLYGWTATEAIAQKASDLLREDASLIPEITQTVVERGEWHGELHKFTKAGNEVIVEGRWTLVRNEAGQPKFILTVNTDITDKKNLEAQFYHAQRLESLGTLASGIAHDLNNVLTPVVALSQLLRMHQPNLDKRSQDMLKVLEESAKRGTNIIKQILAFTRGTEGDCRPVQVASLLQEAIAVIQQTFPKSIAVDAIASDPELWLVSADPTYLHQILMNLCINARDAMPDGGLLTLSAENFPVDERFAQMHLEARAGNYVVITVADTGCGIVPEVRDRIFDPFFTTKATGKGSGLGLSSVLGIVKTYGGFIEVQSQPGEGSQFKVYLPAMVETAVTPTKAQTDLPQGHGELISIVDDENAILQSAQAILETYNYRVITASRGADAIEIYRKYQGEIHAVLLDMMMPDMDGIAVVQALQAINPNVRVIATSGLADNYRQTLRSLGIAIVLTKPFNVVELLNSISQQQR